MGLLNGQPMAKGNLRYVKVSSLIGKAWTVSQLEEEHCPNLKKKNLYIKIKDRTHPSKVQRK